MSTLVRFETRDGSNDSDFTGTGAIGGKNYNVESSTKVRWAIENAGVTNSVALEGRINGQAAFTVLTTQVDDGINETDVTSYDEIRFNCTVFDGGTVNLFASKFGGQLEIKN